MLTGVVYAWNTNDEEAVFALPGVYYTGDITIAKISDAAEKRLVEGKFRVSRADTAAAKNGDLVVTLAFTGTAVDGTDYVAPATTVTIPNGASSVDVTIEPLFNGALAKNTTVVATVQPGANYFVDAATSSATMTIVSADSPTEDIYVDAAAAAGGTGSINAPLASILDAIALAIPDNRIFLKGTFALDEDYPAGIVLGKEGLQLSPWPGALDMPVLEVTSTAARTLTSAYLKIAAANVTLSNLVFRMTHAAIGNTLSIVDVSGADAVIEGCRFELSDEMTLTSGICLPGSGGAISATNVSSGPKIRNCVFDNFSFYPGVNGGADVGVLRLWDGRGTEIIGCTFNNTGRVLGLAGVTWGDQGLQFISNVVVNCTYTNMTGGSSGALMRGGWTYFCTENLVFSHNVFYNEGDASGCLIAMVSKMFQNGISFHNNTVKGYQSLFHEISGDGAAGGGVGIRFINNLVDGGVVYSSVQTTVPQFDKGSIFNNYSTGATFSVPDGYIYESDVSANLRTAAGNVAGWTMTFKSLNPANPKFFRVESPKRTWIYDAYRGSGDEFPGYLGAYEPLSPIGTTVVVR